MKTIDPHSLLTDKIKFIENDNLLGLFTIWKKLIKNKNIETTDFDIFIAGYFLGTNSTLREKYMKLKPKEYYIN